MLKTVHDGETSTAWASNASKVVAERVGSATEVADDGLHGVLLEPGGHLLEQRRLGEEEQAVVDHAGDRQRQAIKDPAMGDCGAKILPGKGPDTNRTVGSPEGEHEVENNNTRLGRAAATHTRDDQNVLARSRCG